MTRVRAWLAGHFPMTAGARYSFIFLFALTLTLAAASLLWTGHEVHANDLKFCDVVHGVTAVPVARPADPRANPARELNWEWYERFTRLGRNLGCRAGQP